MTICRLDAHSYAHSSAIAPPVLQAVWRASLYRSATISVCCPSTISGCVKMLPFEKAVAIVAPPAPARHPCLRDPPATPVLVRPSTASARTPRQSPRNTQGFSRTNATATSHVFWAASLRVTGLASPVRRFHRGGSRVVVASRSLWLPVGPVAAATAAHG